jgi:hypothetical protein
MVVKGWHKGAKFGNNNNEKKGKQALINSKKYK